MLHESLLLVLSLLFVVSMLSILSEKLKISYPIFLVIAGLLIGFIPGIPSVSLSPDIVFLIFLPPLLYSAAWNTSWKDFWEYRRAIFFLSVGLVIFTSAIVAFVSNAIIPGFTLAMGFLLGGIISPPDAVAATSVLQGLKVPKRVVTILEGESLINDASSLIVFRFALAAIMTGHFTMWNATTQFFMVASMGIVVGIAIAAFIYLIHRFFPTSPSVDTGLTLISPYIMYILAEQFHYSGVMAVVSGGLFLSYRSNEIFSHNTRIQAYSFWETLIFMLNGLVFILIGLQLPQIINGLDGYSIGMTVLYGIIISIITVAIRIIWVFPAAYLPRLMRKNYHPHEAPPTWKAVFLVAWSGMRGVVSLASALSIPLTISGNEAFPHRNVLLFITFIVILFTLVLQGLSLPWLIKKLDIESEQENDEEIDLAIRLRMAEAALAHLREKYTDDIEHNEAYKRVYDRYERMAENSYKKLLYGETEADSFRPKYRTMLKEMVSVKRMALQDLRKEKLYPDELLREKEWELDLEDARLDE